ncbi:alcohol dehydrogenase GroES-like domain-containing protein [Decorospora gaudefroyi]|uniref:Alcohol dehydrogenase GroES-like domain-containing protein n=1 Tax=Decorospora gaudefroyi TaxID=184978 RepID=A0A6A5KS24_9PLEO|nr:alcohol dehydrogenase GroES-like domain-containing protein [Decorospora gaudefroyi]
MKALVSGESGDYHVAEDVDVPSPGPGMILCRVHAVSLNPVDQKIIDYSNNPGAVGGFDLAGIVVQIGEGVERFKAGDRVLAVTFGLNPSDRTAGAFAEYALATVDLSCHIPETLSFVQACSMGLSIITAGLALFQAPGLRLSMPRLDTVTGEGAGAFVLVSGGATSTGTMATQFLKIFGYTPIVTCSPANNNLCESFGATACFDYHSSTCGADIREHTGNTLTNVFDCVTSAATMKMCYEAIGSSGGTYITLEPVTTAVKYTRRDVHADWIMAHSALGVPLELPGTFGRPRIPEHRQFGALWFGLIEKLLHEEKIRNHPLEVREGGLSQIPLGLEAFSNGSVRARKLVVPIVA